MRCSVPNCVNDTKQATKSHGLAFLRFPKEASLRVAWAEALGLPAEPQERSTVCSEHFYPDDLYLTKNGLWKVKNGALPVVQEPLEDLDMTAVLRVCRICLATDTKMFDMVEYKLDVMYEEVTGLPLLRCPRLPAAACWQCAGRLRRGAALRRAAAAAHRALADLLADKHNTPLRPALSRARRSLPAGPRLRLQRYEPNDCDLHIKDNQIFVKTETETEDDVTKLEEEDEDNNADVIPPIMEVEIKDEQSNSDMFFEEFLDFDESDDDKKLSEVVTEKKEKVKEKKRKKKLKADKAEKKVKKKEKEKKEKVEEEKTEDDDPNSTMDKYKTSDVKRRRTQDCLDESLFTVTALSYDEQIQDILKRQDSTNYRTAPYKCETCYRGFLNKDRYNAHVIRHSEASGAYECFICKTRLRSGRALRKHLTAQHTEKFSCKGCPFVTRNRGVAREHEKWHAGTKYQCPHCPSEFDKVTTYMGHIRIKHVSDFVCELCGYTFVSRKGVDVHKKKKHRLDDKTVPATGPYCAACDVRFTSAEAHERHLKLSSRHSSDNDPNRIRNDSQSMNAEKHGRVMRKIERRPVVHPREPGGAGVGGVGGSVTCEQCGIQLRDLRLYAQHFRRAHPDKNRTKYPAMKTPCMCEQCGRIFQSMALLKDHMWVHTGEKRFKCDRCDKAFTQKTNLVFHMRVHSNARPSYECPLCGKHFAFFNNRRRHMFIHTGLKPFKCDTCGKCFTTAGEQRAHVDHVHMKKPWPKRVRARQQDWGKQVED